MRYAIKTGTDDQGNNIYFSEVKRGVDVVSFESDKPKTVSTIEEAKTLLTSSKIQAAMFDDANADEYDFEIVEVVDE